MKIYFPYEVAREQQSMLIKDIVETFNEKKVLLAHAPTGLGKTVSSLAPAISFALEKKKKIFFLTPKTGQHQIALETINLLNDKFNLGIKTVDLIGKKGLCLDPFLKHVRAGFYEACSKKKKDRTCKYYNNSRGKTPKQRAIARRKMAPVIERFNKPAIELKEICFVNEVCPYEATLEMCKEADVIIADYAHVFDDGIRKNIFGSAKIELSDSIVIVDEAHNLSNRIRDMYSVNLNETVLELAVKEAMSVGKAEVAEIIKDIGKEIISLGKNLSLSVKEAKLEEADLSLLRKLSKEHFDEINETGLAYLTKSKKEKCALLSVVEFLTIFSRQFPNTLYLVNRKNKLGLNIVPMDVSNFSGKVLNQVYSAVLMSGTLLPLNMYEDIFGIERGVTKEYTSPFAKENRLNLFVDKTTTKYTERNSAQYAKMGEIIGGCANKIPGNVIVFFPSFDILHSVEPSINSSRKILIQEREMSHDKRTELIHNFKALGNSFGGILLAVSGGTIAEGIDFPGEHLLGAIVVGVPFASVSPLTTELIKFYDLKYKKGWDYAYNAPAISKAVQASGRVIRSETDRGVCIFLDKRFSDYRFKKFFPKDLEIKKTDDPLDDVENFFK